MLVLLGPIIVCVGERELTFTPIYDVVFTDEISGKSDSGSNQLLKETPPRLLSDIVLLKLN